MVVRGTANQGTWWGRYIARSITFISVVVAWVFFRAESFPAAIEILKGMVGANGIILPPSYLDYLNYFFSLGDSLHSIGWRFEDNAPYFGGIEQLVFLTFLLIAVWFLPNTYQIFGKHAPIMDSTSVAKTQKANLLIKWRPNPVVAAAVTLLFIIAIFKMDSTSEFLYFQF